MKGAANSEKYRLNVFFIVVPLFAGLILSTFSAFLLLEKPDVRDRDFSLMLAGRVNDIVTDEILRPLLVSRTMAHDQLLIEWLKKETVQPQETNIAEMQTYLSQLKEQFGYTAAFLVSDQTHCYYTWRGLNKVLNPLTDPHDKWYPTFLRKNIPFELNADTDQVNGNHWTVFVNCTITDEASQSATGKKLLGVCGVGMVMDKLQEIMGEYEKEYNVKINLVDSNGLVQMASDSENIQRLYLSNIRLNAEDDSYSVLQTDSGFRISKYLKELGWYLVVQTEGSISKPKLSPLIGLNLLFLCLLAGISLFIYRLLKKRQAVMAAQPKTNDELTGLPNRKYFTEAYGEAGIFNTTRYKTLIIFDVDHFNAVSENEGAAATIRMISDIAKQLFAQDSLILRWGKDVFLVLYEHKVPEAETICQSLCQRVKTEAGVTVSAGIAQINLADTIKKNYYKAMQSCYAAKFAGGNQTMIYRETGAAHE